MDISSQPISHRKDIENYYKIHSRIYDATRWSFLFGRKDILNMIPDLPSHPRILEIGCGTGKNIERLEYHFPDATIVGLDLSSEMLNKAEKRLYPSHKVQLKLGRYGSDLFDYDSFDLILLSYSLTMFGQRAEHIFDHLTKDLKDDGYLAVVDFDTSPLAWFRHWMNINHVDFSGELLPQLKQHFEPSELKVKKAYLGMWTYFQFIGRP